MTSATLSFSIGAFGQTMLTGRFVVPGRVSRMPRDSVVMQVFRWVLPAKGARQAHGLIVDLRNQMLIRACARAGASN